MKPLLTARLCRRAKNADTSKLESLQRTLRRIYEIKNHFRDDGIDVYLIGDNAGLDNAGNVVENLRVLDCVNLGIAVYGKGNIVRDNHIVNTVGRLNVAGGISTAIGAFGSGNMVLNNDVIGTTSAVNDDLSPAQGILFNFCNQCVAEKNRIVDTESPDPNTSRGIWVLTGSDVLIVNNRIIKSLGGISFGLTATGLYRDNIATACTTPYSGGTNAGNNQ